MTKKLLKQILPSISNNINTKKIIKNPQLLPLSGKIENTIILCSDISNENKVIEKFLQIDKEKGAQNYFKVLNNYLDNFSNYILSKKYFSALIESIEGSQIVSIFSNIGNTEESLSLETLAYNSIAKALALSKLQNVFNKRYSKVFTDYRIIYSFGNGKIIKVPAFESTFGISSGELLMGLVRAKSGAFDRKEFQAIGQALENSKLLNNLNNYYRTSIICTDEVWKLASSSSNNEKFAIRLLDKVRFSQNGPVTQLYNILGYTKDITRIEDEEIEIFNTAIDKYYKKDFANAGKLFLQANSLSENNSTALVFANRCKKLIQNGIKRDWDGIINLEVNNLF
ncbi:MAG: hypothetical protein K6C97_11860 [Treponema sp.]|nr:hypothetical protein [Treponema sp.]